MVFNPAAMVPFTPALVGYARHARLRPTPHWKFAQARCAVPRQNHVPPGKLAHGNRLIRQLDKLTVLTRLPDAPVDGSHRHRRTLEIPQEQTTMVQQGPAGLLSRY